MKLWSARAFHKTSTRAATNIYAAGSHHSNASGSRSRITPRCSTRERECTHSAKRTGNRGTGILVGVQFSIWRPCNEGKGGVTAKDFFFPKSGEINGRLRSYSGARGHMFFPACFPPLFPGFLPDGVTNVVYAQTESVEGEKPSFSLLLASNLSLSGSSTNEPEVL